MVKTVELLEAEVMAVGREGEGKPQRGGSWNRMGRAEPSHSEACLWEGPEDSNKKDTCIVFSPRELCLALPRIINN